MDRQDLIKLLEGRTEADQLIIPFDLKEKILAVFDKLREDLDKTKEALETCNDTRIAQMDRFGLATTLADAIHKYEQVGHECECLECEPLMSEITTALAAYRRKD